MNRKLAYLTMVLAACGACAAACNSSSPAGVGGGSDARPDGDTPHDGNPTTDGGTTADGNPTTDGGTTTDGNPTTDGGATDRGVTGPLSWAGIYDSDGVWDLSGPITAQRTIGDVVADLLIGEIVSRSGVPSALQGQAQSVVRSLVGDKIKAAVDAAVPASLKPGSDLMTKLATVLASTQVASTIDLYSGTPARVVKGDEELLTFKFQFQGRTSTLPARDLLDSTLPLVTLAAEWDGTHEAPDTLTINPHEFELRFGKLVLWVAENVLQEVGAGSLATTAASLISCSTITSASPADSRRSRSASGSSRSPSARRRSTPDAAPRSASSRRRRWGCSTWTRASSSGATCSRSTTTGTAPPIGCATSRTSAASSRRARARRRSRRA